MKWFENRDVPIRKCICIKERSNNFYGDSKVKKGLSPTKLDVVAGGVLWMVMLAVLAIIAPFSVPALIIIATVLLLLVLMAIRVFMHHSLECAIKWAVVSLFGLARWFSF